MELNFLTPTKFSTIIEEMVQEKHLTYIDACLEYCSEKNIEPESLGRLVNKSLKQKIQVEDESSFSTKNQYTTSLVYIENSRLESTLLEKSNGRF